MKIAICDDEKIFLEYMKEFVFKTMFDIDNELEVETFLSGNELYKSNEKYDIIILDINMPEINGFDLAKKIRAVNQKVYIVFLTSLFQYVFDSFELAPLRYVMKKSIKERLSATLLSIYEEINLKRDEKYTFYYKSEYHNISIDKIQYFEYKDRKIELHTEDKQYYFYKTLNEIESQLVKNDFVRIHSAFLVNLKYIARLTNKTVLLKNNKELPISKKRYSEIRNIYLGYLKKGL